MKQDYTEELRSLMAQVNISSFQQLAQTAQVSEWQVRQLRRGKLAQMRLDRLLAIAQALNIGVAELVAQCSPLAPDRIERTASSAPMTATPSQTVTAQDIATLQREYERSQAQLAQQRQTLQQEFQRNSIDCLESWMLYWPAAAFAVDNNPDFPAKRLLPLVKPMEQLLAQWGVEAIAPVGETVAYDPQQHQLIKGTANPGDLVRVRNPGYRHHESLLHRAKVEGH